MPDRADIIQKYPIGNGLDGFRASFDAICKSKGIAGVSDALEKLDYEGMPLL